MTTAQEQNKATVVRFNREFIQGGDETVWTETIHPDFVNRSAPPGQQDVTASHFWFTKVLRPAFPDLTVQIDDQVAEGDTVVTRKSYRGTHEGPFIGVAPTHRAVEFTVMDIIRLQDGRYVEHWANPDMFGLHRQLTAEEPPANA